MAIGFAGRSLNSNRSFAGRRHGWSKCLLPAVLCLLLTGCLSTRFVFNQLDWVISWRLNALFSLDQSQEERLRESVARNLDWVRTEQIPAYANLLLSVDQDVNSGNFSPATVETHYQAVIRLWDDFLRHVIPDAAEFLAGLSPEQVDDFIANLEENNEELWKDYAGSTPAQRQRSREKMIVKNVQRFTGRLGRDQKALIAGYVARMHDNSEEWMAGRQRWQQEFRTLLLEYPPADVYAERLLALGLNPNEADASDYRRRVDENRSLVFQMFTALVQSLTDKQRGRLTRQLNELASDLNAIAAESNDG